MKKSFIWKNMEFEISNVKASITKLNNEEVLRVERDLEVLPFDEKQQMNLLLSNLTTII